MARGLVADISVCAVTDGSAATDRALAAQEVGPSVAVHHEEGLAGGLRRGLATGTDWLWLLERSAPPRPRALAALLGALRRVGALPPPAMLAGVVVGVDGRVDRGRAAWYRFVPAELMMAAAAQRLLPIRVASGPLLVSSRVVRARPGPRPGLPVAGALLEWTARVLREEVAYLVPDSEHELTVGGSPPARDARTAIALLLGDAFPGLGRVGLGRELIELAMPRSREGVPHPIA